MSNRIDSIGASLLSLVYLGAAIIATSWYFTEGRVTGLYGIETAGIIMGAATELHSFLTQRRVVYAYRQRAKNLPNDFDSQFRVLCALVAFQIFTGIGYTASTWGGPWWAIALRGGAIPIFFLLSGIMGTLYEDIGEMLKRRQYDMAVDTAKTVMKQHGKRLAVLRKGGHNLAPVLVAMLNQEQDAESAARVQNIDDALGRVERGETVIDSALSFSSTPDDDPTKLSIVRRTPSTPKDSERRAAVRAVMLEHPDWNIQQITDELGRYAYSTVHHEVQVIREQAAGMMMPA